MDSQVRARIWSAGGDYLASIDKSTLPMTYQENETKGHSNTDFENCQKNILAKKFTGNLHDNNSNEAFLGEFTHHLEVLN